MLGTALAQLRLVASIAFGLPVAPWSLDRLVAAARVSWHEFGAIAPEVAELLDGPVLDAETRRAMQARRVRQQAARAARETTYYGRRFAEVGFDPTRLSEADIARLPLTRKAALRDAPDAFVRRGARPALRALTTGTTGRPTAVAFSAAELDTFADLTALGLLATGDLTPDDVVHVAVGGHGIGVLTLLAACARIGALSAAPGAVAPATTLAYLTDPSALPGKKPRPSVLHAHPSYLGELVEVGLALGYRPADFGVERIFTGGEIVTAGLRRRLPALFGEVAVIDGYGMTETFGLAGQTCAAGHLHWHPAHGLVEVLDPETGDPAPPGTVGTLVATPFPPFRDTTLLLRYDTEDLVAALPAALDCPLRHLPATGPVLGKRRLAVRHAGGWTYPRPVLEALESLEAVPLPARYGFWAAPGGVAVEVVARADTPAMRRAIRASLLDHGVPLVALHVETDRRALRRPLPLRCDLRDGGFGAPSQLVHAGEG
jgi:phenylacetate-coenzyme A ligase PaaK-like adenylate-forming protein